MIESWFCQKHGQNYAINFSFLQFTKVKVFIVLCFIKFIKIECFIRERTLFELNVVYPIVLYTPLLATSLFKMLVLAAWEYTLLIWNKLFKKNSSLN